MSKIRTLAYGVGWGTLSTITVTCLQLMFMAVMARLLEPADFGLVAMANISLRFFSFFAQMGTAPALVQKPTLETGDIAAALAVSLGISCLFFCLAQISAPVFENFFNMPELGLIIRVLSFNFIIGGLSTISMAILQRRTHFRDIALIEIASYIIGYGIIGLSASQHGLGVWSLVAAFISQSFVTSILSYTITRHPLRIRHSASQRRHFLSYGGRYSIIGFIEFLAANIDALVVGKVLGASSAGFYNRASMLANLPVQQPSNILTKALFPIMSDVGKNQKDKQAMSLQLSFLLVGSYAFAVSTGIYVAAPDIVSVLLGDKWLDTVPILKMLTWSVGPAYISHVAGVTLDSMNKLSIKLTIQLTTFFLMIGLLLLAVPTGNAIYIAATVVIMEWIRVCIILIKLTRLLKASFKEMCRIVVCIFITAGTTGLTIWSVAEVIDPAFNAIIRLAAEIFAGLIGLLFGFLITRYIAIKLPAMCFLAERAPLVSKIFPRFA